jgi:hypothetical protein
MGHVWVSKLFEIVEKDYMVLKANYIIWCSHLVWDQGVAGSNPVFPTKEHQEIGAFFILL